MAAPGLHPPQTNPLLYPLHLSLAGIFAFILPFICWGALATPGHPHGLPHIVFFAPQMADSTDADNHPAGHDASAPATPERAGDGSSDPAAQSVTPILGVALLAPILLLLAALIAPSQRHFTRRQGMPSYKSLVSTPTPPPPRLPIPSFA